MRREGQEVLDRFALVVVLDIVPTVDESDDRRQDPAQTCSG